MPSNLTETIALELGAQEPWPNDVKLYQPYAMEQILLPDNANCLSVQAFLHMCGLPFQIEHRANAEFMSPSGKVPFIKCGAFVISELEPIVQFVGNKGITLTEDLDQEQKSDLRAYMSIIHTVLMNAELYICWCDKRTYNEVTKPRNGSVYPWPLNYLQTWAKRHAVIKKLKVLGWYQKSLESVYQEVENCCQALSERLEGKEYFFGTKPSPLDALIYGHIFAILSTATCTKLTLIIMQFDNLIGLCKRVCMEYMTNTCLDITDPKEIKSRPHLLSDPSLARIVRENLQMDPCLTKYLSKRDLNPSSESDSSLSVQYGAINKTYSNPNLKSNLSSQESLSQNLTQELNKSNSQESIHLNRLLNHNLKTSFDSQESFILDENINNLDHNLKTTFDSQDSLNLDGNINNLDHNLKTTFDSQDFLNLDGNINNLDHNLKTSFDSQDSLNLDGNINNLEHNLKTAFDSQDSLNLDGNINSLNDNLKTNFDSQESLSLDGNLNDNFKTTFDSQELLNLDENSENLMRQTANLTIVDFNESSNWDNNLNTSTPINSLNNTDLNIEANLANLSQDSSSSEDNKDLIKRATELIAQSDLTLQSVNKTDSGLSNLVSLSDSMGSLLDDTRINLRDSNPNFSDNSVSLSLSNTEIPIGVQNSKNNLTNSTVHSNSDTLMPELSESDQWLLEANHKYSDISLT